MNLKKLIPIIVVAVALISGLAIWQISTAATPSASSQSQPQTPSAGSATVLPVTTNPITNTSTTPGLVITAAAVQDNTDPATRAAIGDRLQLSLKNSGTTPLTGLEIYYTMKDSTTNSTESYYQRLDGVQLAPGAVMTIDFDNKTGAGHYPENNFSLYRSSTNKIDFTIEASATGVEIATATAVKDAGTGEKSD